MTILVGLFSRTPKDPIQKKNAEKFKEFKQLAKQKKYDAALKSGAEYIKKVPNNHDALFTMGGICYLKKKYKTAISYLDKSLEIATYDVDALLLKAYSHQKLGENKRAIQCCEKIQEIDPKNKSVSELLNQLNS
ncbi:MAG: tetratricopeptide repeat protein [Nitrosopumilus sp.]|uniref:tetratricopeptide repeat protein n=1 Tax=Nitrosopumilus sp. TaxID=2024843 RepID=UPI00246FEA74|nr:CDC27 family protein [Nitrosopumilus sp.]MDH5430921.1 tetratricopeptide repeat protein [Nitrosopumilus sp.]MDH5665670.1 tetratricopeptide repeat protein [Nitrosopumilus sp.]